jgi:hypothetical protein
MRIIAKPLWPLTSTHKKFCSSLIIMQMLSVGERGYGNTRHTWLNNSHKISIARWNHIKLESKDKVLKHSLLQHDG